MREISVAIFKQIQSDIFFLILHLLLFTMRKYEIICVKQQLIAWRDIHKHEGRALKVI